MDYPLWQRVSNVFIAIDAKFLIMTMGKTKGDFVDLGQHIADEKLKMLLQAILEENRNMNKSLAELTEMLANFSRRLMAVESKVFGPGGDRGQNRFDL